MTKNELRASWLATWAGMGIEAADYLTERGQEQDGENLNRAITKILDLASEEIGEDVVNIAIQQLTDLWCDGQNLAEDYFADDGSSPASRSNTADIILFPGKYPLHKYKRLPAKNCDAWIMANTSTVSLLKVGVTIGPSEPSPER